ncbi:MAG: hypothetical protein LC803_20250 [Acidobacteria bacterium]|nr:hypothetical protein [Acidobacteriota bacterium]
MAEEREGISADTSPTGKVKHDADLPPTSSRTGSPASTPTHERGEEGA